MMVQTSFPGKPVPAALRGGVLACGVLAAAWAAEATAGDAAAAPAWKLSGFGTLGAVHASTRTADFTSTVLRATGAGRSARWSAEVDSRLGAQLDVVQGPWSAVLQLVSEQDLEGSYRPRVEWASISYQASPDLALRLGRIALPVFLAADYRKVGYAMHAVRPPVEVYGSLPLSSSDGVDATWRWSTGATRHATQAFLGRTDTHLYEDRRLKGRGIAGLSHSIERGPLSARMSALSADLTTGIGVELFTALRGLGPQGAALAGRYAIDSKRVSMVNAGVSYDPGPWFASAEAGRTHSRSLLGQTTSMHIGAGLRTGNLTPYLGYARVRAHGATRDPGLGLAGLPPQAQALAAVLNAGLNAYLSTIPVQSTLGGGLRWDVATDVALKLQYDRVRPGAGSRGAFINQQAAFRRGETVHVASVALDYVF
ncbi:hypothetical protein [Massilia yuzhufengensis]|uniref:Porin n=1 Tax=Massilia yuzhufengensis TaxID=1164594 RepID=A0A1I1EYT9_9BURK|nr:hypothetical protein [Massilia yuzhufengensis]SFB91896.1 hypothetical protein SAMN05216204_102285 [Massilia yuzhufengensis]